MAHNVPIEVFLIQKSGLDRAAIDKWLGHIGVKDFRVPEVGTDPANLISLAAKRCYKSFEVGLNPNIQKVRTDLAEYLDNVLKQGHGSVLEHATYTFAIEGVSRVFTGEMNRHRAGWAISEGSMRFIRYTDIPWWLPTSITEAEGDAPELAGKKLATRMVFDQIFGDIERAYSKLQSIWSDELSADSKFAGKKHITSMMRRIIPMGVATGGVWTGNMRAVRHVIAMRTSPAAEEEILYVFSNIAKAMVESEPMLFGDFQQVEGGFWVPKYQKV